MEPYRGTNRYAGQAAGLQSEHDGVSNIYLDLNLFNFDSHLAFCFDTIIRVRQERFDTVGTRCGVPSEGSDEPLRGG